MKKKAKVTLRSLGRELGIAPATVLRTLTNRPNVMLNTRRRVIALAQKRGYQLPEHETKLAAVLIPGFEFEGYTGLLLAPLLRELSENRFHAVILSDRDLSALRDHVYAGVISIVWTGGLERIWPEEHATPFVALNAAANLREGIHRVSSDENQGIVMGLEALYRKGRRRLVFVSPPSENNLNAEKRLQAFRDFLREKNLSETSFSEEVSEGNDLERIAETIFRRKADGVFVACETYAPRILFHFQRKGIMVPGEVSVLALEHRFVSPFTTPPLTTVSQDFDKLAKEAVRLLMDQIRGESRRDVLVPYRFIERESI